MSLFREIILGLVFLNLLALGVWQHYYCLPLLRRLLSDDDA